MLTTSIPRASYVPDSEDLAPEYLACPHCGERQTDRLIIGRGDGIRCRSCGRTYKADGRASEQPKSAAPEPYCGTCDKRHGCPSYGAFLAIQGSLEFALAQVARATGVPIGGQLLGMIAEQLNAQRLDGDSAL